MRTISIPPSFTQSSSTRFTVGGDIEWEELPSLADSLTQRLGVLGSRHRDALAAARARALAFERVAQAAEQVWAATLPAELAPIVAPEPFREPVDGLAIREVHEPDLFRHFFGRPRLGE